MKKYLKFTSAALAAVTAMSLVACGSSSSGAASTASSEAASTEAASTEAASTEAASTEAASTETTAQGSGTPLKILIISSTGVDDGSFNQNNYEGIQDFLADHSDCSVQDIKEPDYNNLIPTVDQLSGDYNVFVLPGFNFSAVGDIAKANPDNYYIVVDSTITDADGNAVAASDLGNVYTMTFKEQESGFFAGVAAALTTKSGKVAVVNGMAYPSNVNYQYGFMSGVNYAVKKYGAKAECVELPSYAGTDVTGANVGGNYTGDFGDETTGKVVGEQLIKQGCDVIFVAAGASGNGTLTAIKEASGVYFIGCDVDQYDDGANGSSNVTLTSALKVMRPNVEKQLNAIYDGTFKAEDATLGADSDSTGYVSEKGRQQLSEDALSKLEECYKGVKDGSIVPASNFNGYKPDDFPGLN